MVKCFDILDVAALGDDFRNCSFTPCLIVYLDSAAASTTIMSASPHEL